MEVFVPMWVVYLAVFAAGAASSLAIVMGVALLAAARQKRRAAEAVRRAFSVGDDGGDGANRRLAGEKIGER
jgi:hypothetical protein